jgi:hypothetical protein
MEQYTEAFVGIDTAKNKHALAIADPGRDGEIRYLGEIDSGPATVQRMIRKLVRRIILSLPRKRRQGRHLEHWPRMSASGGMRKRPGSHTLTFATRY